MTSTWLEEIRARLEDDSYGQGDPGEDLVRAERDLARCLEALEITMEALEYYVPSPDWYGDKAREALERIEALSHPNSKDYPALEDE